MLTLDIEIFGTSFQVKTDAPYIYEHLLKDFFFYKKTSSTPAGLSLMVLRQSPPVNRVPKVDACLHSSGFICYKDKNIQYTVYDCGGLLIYDFQNETIEIFGTDEFFIYERAKLSILSRLGQLSDKQQLHRLHAFGITLHGKSLICILPMEGGKTTTTLNLFKKEPHLRIIADDMCFIDKNCNIHPFLLRIGARDKDLVNDIPDRFVNEINRPYYGVKYFIDPEIFQASLAKHPSKLNYILIGERSLHQETRIKRIANVTCLGILLNHLILGPDLPQLEEFFIRRDWPWIKERLRGHFSRFVLGINLILKTKIYIISMGRDKASSVEKILELLK